MRSVDDVENMWDAQEKVTFREEHDDVLGPNGEVITDLVGDAFLNIIIVVCLSYYCCSCYRQSNTNLF